MKIPDKVYGKVIQNNILDCSIQNNGGGLEYIRKDVILKWAKEQYDSYANRAGLSAAGRQHAFKEMIDKLNKL